MPAHSPQTFPDVSEASVNKVNGFETSVDHAWESALNRELTEFKSAYTWAVNVRETNLNGVLSELFRSPLTQPHPLRRGSNTKLVRAL